MRFFSSHSRHAKKETSLKGMFGSGIMAGLSACFVTIIFLNFTPFSTQAAGESVPFTLKDIQDAQKYLDDRDQSIENLSAKYHSTVNMIMNAYTKAFFVRQAADQKAKILTIVKPPEDVKECDSISANMNISTYCLFLRVDGLYQTYSRSLRLKQDTSLQEIQDILQANNNQGASAGYYVARSEWINREFTSTQKALDSGLKAYSELLAQYPLHLEYGKTINLLVKYYDAIIDIRKKVDTYPARFQNVTTAQCQ